MEATSETMQRCLVLALTPVLNQMSVMGIVSIPGMMTGQILGGTSPSQVPLSQMLHATRHVIGCDMQLQAMCGWPSTSMILLAVYLLAC